LPEIVEQTFEPAKRCNESSKQKTGKSKKYCYTGIQKGMK